MNRKLLLAAMGGLLLLYSNACVLVDAGAGRRSECSRISGLARTGEHKPAADSYEGLVQSGRTCSDDVVQRVSTSRSRVERADNFVRKAFQRRKEGNLLSARANLQEALKIYPNYYWVQNLLRNLERSIEAEINGLKGEAQYLESSGDFSGALKRVGDARLLAPEDPFLQAEAARLEQAMGRAQKEKEIDSVLARAAEHMNAGRFDEAEGTLTAGDVSGKLGPRGAEMLASISRNRSELIEQRYAVAREAERNGEVEVAAGHARYVLELSRPDDSTVTDIVEFARLLGVKLFSTGKLVRAKDLWGAAYALDPGNERLATYLREVDARLESLERIKEDDGGAK